MMRGLLNRIRSSIHTPRPAIVMYHRIADITEDPWGLAVSPVNFAAQLHLMRRHRTILPLSEFVDCAQAGRLANDAIALTFDDGYLDNLTHAAPLLAQADAPATLFLTTGTTERATQYWWDTLAALTLNASPLRSAITIGHELCDITLGEPEPLDAQREHWRAWEPRTARERLHWELWNRIRPMGPIEIAGALETLRAVFGREPVSLARAMNESEVVTLSKSTPFTVENHTVDHLDLSMQNADRTLRQIHGATEWIRESLGHNTTGFSYPYGRNTQDTRVQIRAAGFAYACTVEYGFVAAATDPYGLPRLTATNVPHIHWLIPTSS